jgi:hypothetical protein
VVEHGGVVKEHGEGGGLGVVENGTALAALDGGGPGFQAEFAQHPPAGCALGQVLAQVGRGGESDGGERVAFGSDGRCDALGDGGPVAFRDQARVGGGGRHDGGGRVERCPLGWAAVGIGAEHGVDATVVHVDRFDHVDAVGGQGVGCRTDGGGDVAAGFVADEHRGGRAVRRQAGRQLVQGLPVGRVGFGGVGQIHPGAQEQAVSG